MWVYKRTTLPLNLALSGRQLTTNSSKLNSQLETETPRSLPPSATSISFLLSFFLSFLKETCKKKKNKRKNRMESSYSFVFIVFIFSVLLVPLFSDGGRGAPSPTPSPTPTESPPEIERMTEQQVANILSAMEGASDFKNWADVFVVSDPTSFPVGVTVFLPVPMVLEAGAFFFNNQMLVDEDPFSLLEYHTVPERLSFRDLLKLPIGHRLQTLAGKQYSIVITNNSISHYTIDHISITLPDMVINGAFNVHGIQSILNYSAYGTEESTSKLHHHQWQSPPHMVAGGVVSDASPPPPPPCLCFRSEELGHFIMILSVVLCAIFALEFF